MKEEKSCIICAYGEASEDGDRICNCLAKQMPIDNPQVKYCDFFKKTKIKKAKNITKEVIKDAKHVMKRLKLYIENAMKRREKQEKYLKQVIEEKALLSDIFIVCKNKVEELEKGELEQGEYMDSGKEACYKRIKLNAKEEIERIERRINRVKGKIKDIGEGMKEEEGELEELKKRAKKQKVKLIED